MTPIPQFQIHWPRLAYAVAIYGALVASPFVCIYASQAWPLLGGLVVLGLFVAGVSLVAIRAIYQMLSH